MVSDGIIIMAVGMLVVFAFLAIMVIMMRFMSSYILKFFPETNLVPAKPETTDGNEAELAVAIAVTYTKN